MEKDYDSFKLNKVERGLLRGDVIVYPDRSCAECGRNITKIESIHCPLGKIVEEAAAVYGINIETGKKERTNPAALGCSKYLEKRLQKS
jgi:hypothetical protein